MSDCPRDATESTDCPTCGARTDEDCPLTDLTEGLLTTPAVGAVQGAACEAEIPETNLLTRTDSP